MKVLIVSPKTPDTFWSFAHALPFVSKKSAHPPLGLLTVAASLPDHWDLRLIDMDVSRLDDADLEWADYVMIGGMVVHKNSIREVADRCLRLERPVIAGGPGLTMQHDEFPEIPHIVLGETEELMDELVADMEKGKVKERYQAPSFPDVTKTPIPRWDLINLDDYATMMIQFSRGCPFNCEFCGVIALNGRVPRTKTPDQLIAELESLRERGYVGEIFVVDDNFIGHKRKAKDLLRALVAWREECKPNITFLTEASVNLADDEELLRLMAEAGFKKVFLGIETPDEDSLEECQKVQNTGKNLVQSVHKIQAAGLEVMGGFIVGFDNDKPDVFARQFQFIQRAGVTTAMVGLLTALPRTQLYQRLMKEGRILQECSGNNVEGEMNFVPVLGRAFLVHGYRRLMKHLYEPKIFYERARSFLANYRPSGPQMAITADHVRALLRSFWVLGVRYRGRRSYWRFLAHALVRHPRAIGVAVSIAIQGHHFRQVAGSL
jgi:radical SAM superfamily enzyme YgiQ (UPF0313 family)